MKQLIIIQARMGSKRLPGKVLMPIYRNKNIVDIILDKFNDEKCVLAIPESDLPDFSYLKNRVEICTGDEENVYSRFVKVIKKHQPEIVVRVCADNPFICPKYVMFASGYLKSYYSYQYVSNWKDVEGTRFEIFKASCLNSKRITESDKEHVTTSIQASARTLILPRQYDFEGKFSVDTKRDFFLAKSIFYLFNREDVIIADLHRIYRFLTEKE